MYKGENLEVKDSVMETLSIRANKKCPHCGRTMVRIPRKNWHRMVSKVFQMTRWECCGERWLVIER